MSKHREQLLLKLEFLNGNLVSVNVTKYKEFPQLYVLQIFAELLTIMHIFYKFIIITLQYFHSDTMMIVDDVQESDSTTVSGINVCGESMPATVCAEVASFDTRGRN